MADVPQLFIVRYKRNATLDNLKVEKRPKGLWNPFQEDVDPASQLVARYNGSDEIPEVQISPSCMCCFFQLQIPTS